MNKSTNSDIAAGTYVVAPEFSLLNIPDSLYERTARGFDFADAKGRRILFGMRQLLSTAFPCGSPKNNRYDDYIRALNSIQKYLKYKNIPEDISILFPGSILPIQSKEYIDSISELNGHFTVDLKEKYTENLLRFILENGLIKDRCINIITDRIIKPIVMETICNLWDLGADLTLCYGCSALRMLKLSGLPTKEQFDIYNGALIIPGKTLVKSVSVNQASFAGSENADILYSQIKEKVISVLENEVNSRFARSPKGKLYYRHDGKFEPMDPLGLFYSGSISEKESRINNIFLGGAEFDILSISITGSDENNGIISDYLAATCKVCDGSYPIKAVPSVRDIRYTSSMNDIKNIISSHTRTVRNSYGGSVLELTVSDKFDLTNYKEIGNAVSALFGSGGTMIRITKEGARNGGNQRSRKASR